MADETPELAFRLDLRALRAWIELEGGRPVLHLSDGRQHIALESILGDSLSDAIDNALTLARTVKSLASALDAGRPVDWWQPEETSGSGSTYGGYMSGGY